MDGQMEEGRKGGGQTQRIFLIHSFHIRALWRNSGFFISMSNYNMDVPQLRLFETTDTPFRDQFHCYPHSSTRGLCVNRFRTHLSEYYCEFINILDTPKCQQSQQHWHIFKKHFYDCDILFIQSTDGFSLSCDMLTYLTSRLRSNKLGAVFYGAERCLFLNNPPNHLLYLDFIICDGIKTMQLSDTLLQGRGNPGVLKETFYIVTSDAHAMGARKHILPMNILRIPCFKVLLKAVVLNLTELQT